VEKPANQDKELKNGSEAESERNAKEKSAEVERKRTLERRNEKEGASRNQTEQKSNTYSKKLTPEERQKRLEQMQADAKTHQKDRLEEIKRAKDIELKEKEQLLERAKNSDTIKKNSLAPDFIASMGREVYNDKSTASLQDRLQRNRFYVQRTSDEH